MNSNVIIPTKKFQGEAKRLLKKFSSLKNELINLYKELEDKPNLGTSLGNGIYKIRVAVRSKGKGKSGGLRIITYCMDERKDGFDIYLISIYDKSEEATITKDEVLKEIKTFL